MTSKVSSNHEMHYPEKLNNVPAGLAFSVSEWHSSYKLRVNVRTEVPKITWYWLHLGARHLASVRSSSEQAACSHCTHLLLRDRTKEQKKNSKDLENPFYLFGVVFTQTLPANNNAEWMKPHIKSHLSEIWRWCDSIFSVAKTDLIKSSLVPRHFRAAPISPLVTFFVLCSLSGSAAGRKVKMCVLDLIIWTHLNFSTDFFDE